MQVGGFRSSVHRGNLHQNVVGTCLLYTSDAADERSSVDLGGRRIIKKKYCLPVLRRGGDGNNEGLTNTGHHGVGARSTKEMTH